MSNNKQSLSGIRILITNDDGIDANGIKALEKIAYTITPDVWVVAPQTMQSGKGAALTFENALRVKEISPRKFAVSGTPSDCVYVALNEILKDKKPDLVLSGINHGHNLADFVPISGTVGATIAAASQGIRSIALSQHFAGRHCELSKFPLADHFLHTIVKRLMSFEWPNRLFMNINFPMTSIGEISGVKITKQGKFDIKWEVHKKIDPVDDPYFWLRAIPNDVSDDPLADSKVLETGKYITITPLMCRYEFNDCNDKLEELFSSNV